MGQHAFINALRIMMSIDHQEVPFLDAAAWQAFNAQPYRFLMRADDATATRIYAVIERRNARAVASTSIERIAA